MEPVSCYNYRHSFPLFNNLSPGQVLNESTFRWEIGIIRYNEDGTPDEPHDIERGIYFLTLSSGKHVTAHKLVIP